MLWYFKKEYILQCFYCQKYSTNHMVFLCLSGSRGFTSPSIPEGDEVQIIFVRLTN